MRSIHGLCAAVMGIFSVSCSFTAGRVSSPQTAGGAGSDSSPQTLAGTGGSASFSSGGTGSGGSGSTGHNRLRPETYYKFQKQLDALMQSQLPGATTPAIQPILDYRHPSAAPDESYSGKLFLAYAVGCALPSTHSVTWVDGNNVPHTLRGENLMRFTKDWLGSGLGEPATRDDVHACLVTRLNPQGEEVQFWLGGSRVENNSGSDPGNFKYEEALWLVDRSAEQRIRIQVWPAQEGPKSCASGPNGPFEQAIRRRVCGSSPGACNLTVRWDRDVACAPDPKTSDPHDWICEPTAGNCPGPSCSPVPVLRTRLDETAWKVLYPDCPQ